jgi:hypothetical protein
MGGAASFAKAAERKPPLTGIYSLQVNLNEAIVNAAIASRFKPEAPSAVPVAVPAAPPGSKSKGGRGRRRPKANFVPNRARFRTISEVSNESGSLDNKITSFMAKTISDSGDGAQDDCWTTDLLEKTLLEPQDSAGLQPRAPQKPKQCSDGKRPRPCFAAHISRDWALGGLSTDSSLQVSVDLSGDRGDTGDTSSHIVTVDERSMVDLTTCYMKNGDCDPIWEENDFTLESVAPGSPYRENARSESFRSSGTDKHQERRKTVSGTISEMERLVWASTLESSGLASGFHRIRELQDREQATHYVVQPPKHQHTARLNTRTFASAPSRMAQGLEGKNSVCSP